MDRNLNIRLKSSKKCVALRKESVDRNPCFELSQFGTSASLSARRAWIEIGIQIRGIACFFVALRKESVDRNRL